MGGFASVRAIAHSFPGRSFCWKALVVGIGVGVNVGVGVGEGVGAGVGVGVGV